MRWENYLTKVKNEPFHDFFHDATIKYATLAIELANLHIIPNTTLRTHRTNEQKRIMDVMWQYAIWAGK